MNNLKTFKQFLNEGNVKTNEASNAPKLKVGDVGEDYFENKVKITHILLFKEALAMCDKLNKNTDATDSYECGDTELSDTDLCYVTKIIKSSSPEEFQKGSYTFTPTDESIDMYWYIHK